MPLLCVLQHATPRFLEALSNPGLHVPDVNAFAVCRHAFSNENMFPNVSWAKHLSSRRFEWAKESSHFITVHTGGSMGHNRQCLSAAQQLAEVTLPLQASAPVLASQAHHGPSPPAQKKAAPLLHQLHLIVSNSGSSKACLNMGESCHWLTQADLSLGSECPSSSYAYQMRAQKWRPQPNSSGSGTLLMP